MLEMNTDLILLTFAKQFISNNIMTITLVLAILKKIAIETKWAGDDKIIQIFTGFVAYIQDRRAIKFPEQTQVNFVEEVKSEPISKKETLKDMVLGEK